MIDERLVTKLLGVGPEYQVTQMEEVGGGLRLHLNFRDKAFVCPKCGSLEVSRKGRRHLERNRSANHVSPVGEGRGVLGG